MVANPINQMTETEYLAFDRQSEDKYGYVNGEIYAMSGGSHAHNKISAYTIAALIVGLGDKPCTVYSSDMKVQVAATGMYTYPDVSVVCGENYIEDETHQDILLNPTLLVEVLSPSSEAYDRGAKFSPYRQLASLQEYLIIAQDQAQVERYWRQADGDWLLTVATGLDANIELPSLGIHLALADIYRKVDFSTNTTDADNQSN